MRNRSFILFWLWLAFSVVLGHSIVPHHHHDEQEKCAHHEEEDDAFADFFSHFAHAPHTITVTFHFSDETRLIKSTETAAHPDVVFIPAQALPVTFVYRADPGKLPDSPERPGPRSPRAPPAC